MSEDGSIKLARDLSPGNVIRVHGKACVVENVYARPGDPPKVLVRHTHGEESYFADAEVLIVKPSPLAGAKLWEYLDKCEDVRNLYLEMMTAAYLSMTDIPPDRVSLVQDVKDEDGQFRMTWHFKERGADDWRLVSELPPQQLWGYRMLIYDAHNDTVDWGTYREHDSRSYTKDKPGYWDYFYLDYASCPKHFEVTHWMPLPEKPIGETS